MENEIKPWDLVWVSDYSQETANNRAIDTNMSFIWKARNWKYVCENKNWDISRWKFISKKR